MALKSQVHFQCLRLHSATVRNLLVCRNVSIFFLKALQGVTPVHDKTALQQTMMWYRFSCSTTKRGKYQRGNTAKEYTAIKELILPNPALFAVIYILMMSFDIGETFENHHRMSCVIILSIFSKSSQDLYHPVMKLTAGCVNLSKISWNI